MGGLRAEQPAAEFGTLGPADLGAERAVGRLEHVVAFVEHVARGNGVVVEALPGGLRHHQRVVGDDQLGGAGAAHGVFDEAAFVMRAAAVDAFAAAVRERIGELGAEQFGEPAGQVAAGEVAILGGAYPAQDQAERDDAVVLAGQRLAHLVLEVQQAEIVFAALADDHAAAAVGGIGVQAGEFGVDLALQQLGVGADPDSAGVALGPEAGGRDVAQGFAGAGAGFG